MQNKLFYEEYKEASLYFDNLSEKIQLGQLVNLLHEEGFRVSDIWAYNEGAIIKEKTLPEYAAVYDGAEEHFDHFADAVKWIDECRINQK